MMMDASPVRRRRYSVEFKRCAVAESYEAGQSAARVARRYGLNANLLFRWRRDARLNGGHGLPALLPVELKPGSPPSLPAAAAPEVSTESRIEVDLRCGSTVRFGHDIGEETLYRVVSVLRRFT